MSVSDPQQGEVFVIRSTWWRVTRRTPQRIYLENITDEMSVDRVSLRRWIESWMPDVWPYRALTKDEVVEDKIDRTIPCIDEDEDG